MRNISYPRMEILRELDRITSGLSANRFISTRPPSVEDAMQDFLLIRLPFAIRDRGDTYQSTRGQIAVFVRDISGGLENTLRLDQLQQAVTDLFPVVTDLFHARMPILQPGDSDSAGFHSLIVQFNITIFKTPDSPPLKYEPADREPPVCGDDNS